MEQRFFSADNGEVWTLTELREVFGNDEDCGKYLDPDFTFEKFLSCFREITREQYAISGGLYY